MGIMGSVYRGNAEYSLERTEPPRSTADGIRKTFNRERHYEWSARILQYKYSVAVSSACLFFVLLVLHMTTDFNPEFTLDIRATGARTVSSVLRELAQFVLHPETSACLNVQEVGGNYDYGSLDGVKMVCLDTIDPPNCLIYSFGIADDWSFDDDMHAARCEVHSFDPSIGQPSHRRNERHWFHPWGLHADTAHTLDSWILLTLTEVRKRLGHENRRIDILKMDVEGAEWKFFQSNPTVLKDVGQLIVEFHLFTEKKRTKRLKLMPKSKLSLAADLAWSRVGLLKGLNKAGFTLFRYHRNGPDLKPYLYINEFESQRMDYLPSDNIQYELSFIKNSKVALAAAAVSFDEE